MTPSDSARSTRSASESSGTTGQMSLFGTMCERSRLLTSDGLFTTPSSDVSMRNTRYAQGGTALGAQVSASSPPAIPASHSQSPGSDWARKMTATYGRKLSAYWLSSDPPDSWVKTLLAISTWASTTCYLTWKKSVTPHGRLLFRLVPSTPHTAGIGSGLWGTPTSRDHKDTGSMENVPVNGLLGRQVLTPEARMWPTPRASENELRTTKPTPSQIAGKHGKSLSGEVQMGGSLKLNSAWVAILMGFPPDWCRLED